MAKKITPPPVETVEKKPQPVRISGEKIVEVISTGLAPTMRTKGKVYRMTADNAQCLIDKGYATLRNA